MSKEETKLVIDTIRAMAKMLQLPATEQNHIDRTELAEAGEIVARRLEG